MKATLGLLIIDDHLLFLAGMRDMMSKHDRYDVDIHSEEKQIKSLDFTKYDILVTDLSMRSWSGYDVVEYAKRRHPQIKTLILSVHDGVGHIQRAREIGADGYLLKESTEQELLTALQTLGEADFYLSDPLKNKIEALNPSTYLLTPREEEIVRLMLEQRQNSEISSILSISENTVKTHRKNILAKLRSNNIDSLSNYAKEYLTP